MSQSKSNYFLVNARNFFTSLIFFLSLFIVFGVSNSSLAHEGHDKTPGSVSAPHGGQIKGTNQLYLEVVADNEGFKIYPMDHDLKSIALNELNLEANIQFPKKSKTENIKLTLAESFAEAKVESKGAHRYNANIKVTYKNKTDTVSFVIEP